MNFQLRFGTIVLLSLSTILPVMAGPEVRFLQTPDEGIQPRAAVGSDGTLHLVYFKGDPMAGDLFYVKRSSEEGVFRKPIRVNGEGGNAIAAGTIRGAQMALGRDDRVHVAWMGSAATDASGEGRHPMLYTRMKDDGSAFEPGRNVMTRTGGLDGGGSVAADSSGDVYVAWHGREPGAAEGEAGRAVYVAISRDDGKTFAPEIMANPGPTGTCGCCGMRAFVDAGDRLHLLYRAANPESRDMTMLTSSDGGRSFTSQLVGKWFIQSCPMSSSTMMDTDAGIFAAVETEGKLGWSRWIASSGTLLPAVPVAPSKGKHPAMAENGRGEVLIAWVEGALWGRGGRLKWRIFDRDGEPESDVESGEELPVWSFPAVVATGDSFFIIW